MIIDLSKDYRIKTIPLNVVLQRHVIRVSKKIGETYDDWEDVGYYSSIQNAIKDIPKHIVLENSCKDYLELCNKINDLAKELGGKL
jgi:hypothetical protein